MKEEPIYRVKVEVIGKEPEGYGLDKTLLEGIECEGFALIAIHGDGTTTAMQHVTTLDIAKAISNSGDMLGAATIAKAMHEASRYESEEKSKGLLKTLMDSMKN